MGEKAYRFLIFLAGAVAGSAVTYKVLNDKYAKLAHDEIEEVREYYNSKLSESEEIEVDDLDDEDVEVSDEEVAEYEAMVENEGYSNEPKRKELKHYEYEVIEPEEFGTKEGYDTIYLTLYADEYLADDQDELVEDVEDKIGWENLNRMGEYEDDILHVRNYTLECDYEISYDSRNYSDVIDNPEED